MSLGNKTRDSTLTNHHEKNRLSKRQKTSHEVLRGGTVVAVRGNPNDASSVRLASDLSPGAHEPMPPSDSLALASGQDVTEIFDDDEDRPNMGRLDKGKGREGASLARRLETSCSMDEFEFDDLQGVQIQSVKSTPPVSTRKRQRSVNEDAIHSRSASPIEYCSSSPTTTSSRPPPKRKIVKHTETAPRVNEDAVHSRSASPIEYRSSSPTTTSSRPPPKRKIVKHTETAPRVNEDAVHSRSASPIEYRSSSPTTTSSRPPPKRKIVKHTEIAPRGVVKALVRDNERKLENCPRIDWRQQQVKGPGLKNLMKAKSSTPALKPVSGPSKLPVNQDPLNSSTFKKQTKLPYFGRQSTNGVSGSDLSLPLNQFYLGVRRLDGNDWVVSWGEGDMLVLKSGDTNTTFDSYEFDMRKEIASVMYLPLEKLEDDSIGMKILTGRSRRDFPGTKQFFDMGDKLAGAIVLSFNVTHRDWDPDSYNGLVQWMKHRTQTDTIDIWGFRNALRTAKDKYEACAWVVKRVASSALEAYGLSQQTFQ